MNEFSLYISSHSVTLNRALQRVVEHQNAFATKVNLYSNESSEFLRDFDFGVNLPNRLIRNLAPVLLIDEDPYLRENGENYSVWYERVKRLHNIICRYKKIVSTSHFAYKSLIFKHSQKIYYDELPSSLRFAEYRIKGNGQRKIVFVVEDHPVYRSRFKKLSIIKNLEIILVERNSRLSDLSFSKIINSNSVYWMIDFSLSYRNFKVDSESLSLSGIRVNVKDSSEFGTYYGNSLSGVLMDLRLVEVLQYFPNDNYKRSNEKSNKNIFINFLHKHSL